MLTQVLKGWGCGRLTDGVMMGLRLGMLKQVWRWKEDEDRGMVVRTLRLGMPLQIDTGI